MDYLNSLIKTLLYSIEKLRKKQKMGQQLLPILKEQIHHHSPQKDSSNSPQLLLTHILQQAEDLAGHPLTSQEIHQHLLNYLETQSQPPEETRKRSRSYQLVHQQETHMEEPSSSNEELGPGSKMLEEKMKWLEDIEDEVRTNITEIMTTQKPFKIRQNFRRLILQLLKIDNLWLYVIHSQGKLEFHDFQKNYINDQTDEDAHQQLESIINEGWTNSKKDDILKLFKITSETDQSHEYSWNVFKESKLSSVYLIKKLQYDEPCRFQPKVISKIAKTAMISTSEEESNVLQTYSKQFLQILELLVKECEIDVCQCLGSKSKYLFEVEKEMVDREEKDQNLMARVRAFQQLQFQLLERLRMYKKYVCQDNKIFLEFDQSAQLSFLSNNYSHPLLKNLPKLWQRKKMFLQKIFQDYKPINDFIKKAVKKKVKSNKLYQLNFQTKVRVIYDEDGRILRMHVIFEELEDSSSNSSQIYNSSSTKILSQGSGKGSFNDLEEGEDKERRQSALVRNLERNNPGIINQGWINLFIKDQQLNPRQNTYFKNKPGKGYTIKRSVSLNSNIDSVIESSDPKDNLHHINTQSIDLNLLDLDEDLLEPFALKVFKKLDFYHSDNFKEEQFLNFLSDVHNGYQIHNNPFHNFTHGVNVMHTCYILANSTKNRQPLSPFKIFTIVFSGLCHDVGHTGFTNLFQIASGSKKAITYNDNSPLQNFHAATTFELLRKPENNFLKNLSPQQLKDFRKSVISSILFTDIKEHFPLIKKFKAILNDQLPFNDEYLSILSGMIVHTADFGGSAKEFQICRAWSLKVNLEFSNQYKREGELGLPQTPFLKDLNNISVLSKNEGGFLKVIVFPLYECMDDFCVNDPRVQKLREYAETNIEKWQKIHLQSSEKQKQETKKK